MSRKIVLFVVGFSFLVAIGQADQSKPKPPEKPAVAEAAKGQYALMNMARAMKEFKKWQYWSNTMQNKRFDAQAELLKAREEATALEKKIAQNGVNEEDQEKLRSLKREFEDKEIKYRKSLDAESSELLKVMYQEIQICTKALAKEEGYLAVFAHIDATTDEERASPMLIDMKMRPSGMVPFYHDESIDVSDKIVKMLNDTFKAPGPIPTLKK